MTTYSISVQAAGCLPDSDTYPYTVEGLEEAVEAVMNEMAEDTQAPVAEWQAGDVRADLSETGSFSIDLGGTYILEAIEV